MTELDAAEILTAIEALLSETGPFRDTRVVRTKIPKEASKVIISIANNSSSHFTFNFHSRNGQIQRVDTHKRHTAMQGFFYTNGSPTYAGMPSPIEGIDTWEIYMPSALKPPYQPTEHTRTAVLESTLFYLQLITSGMFAPRV